MAVEIEENDVRRAISGAAPTASLTKHRETPQLHQRRTSCHSHQNPRVNRQRQRHRVFTVGKTAYNPRRGETRTVFLHCVRTLLNPANLHPHLKMCCQ